MSTHGTLPVTSGIVVRIGVSLRTVIVNQADPGIVATRTTAALAHRDRRRGAAIVLRLRTVGRVGGTIEGRRGDTLPLSHAQLGAWRIATSQVVRVGVVEEKRFVVQTGELPIGRQVHRGGTQIHSQLGAIDETILGSIGAITVHLNLVRKSETIHHRGIPIIGVAQRSISGGVVLALRGVRQTATKCALKFTINWRTTTDVGRAGERRRTPTLPDLAVVTRTVTVHARPESGGSQSLVRNIVIIVGIG